MQADCQEEKDLTVNKVSRSECILCTFATALFACNAEENGVGGNANLFAIDIQRTFDEHRDSEMQ